MIFAAFVVTFFLLGFGSSAANDLGSIGKHGSIYRPVQLSYRGLFDSNALDNSLMLENLSNVGMIAITDMPTFFRQAKHTMQSLLPSCLDSMDKNNSYVFEDGTKRTTIATHTLASGDMAPLQLSSKDAACTGFEAASVAFRAEVDRVTRLFAQRLSELCESDSNVPLLQSKDDQVFATFADIVELGEHLEHFHKYQKQVAGNTDSTIEWHTDQGMFLVFAPGVLVDRHSAVEETVADGFYIELSNGGRPMVQFDDSDDLVVLLGDGIRQVKADQCGTTSLRPLPHALSMPSTFNEIRVWYGRMILAPASAVHPEHEHEGWTFGDLRVRMIDQEGSDPSIMALGCSGSASIARQLEETSCEEGTLYCKFLGHPCLALATCIHNFLLFTQCRLASLHEHRRTEYYGNLVS